MNNKKIIQMGAWSLIVFGVLYFAMQAYLHFVFDYPAVLHGPDTVVLPLLASVSDQVIVVLTMFSMTPLLLVVGSIGFYILLRDESEFTMKIALVFATLLVICLIFCWMRWPSLNWYFALFYGQTDETQRGLLSAVLFSLNTYLGTYIGGFLASVCASIWFFITGAAVFHTQKLPQWVGIINVGMGVYLLIAIIDIFTTTMGFWQHVLGAAISMSILWLIVLGVTLLRLESI